MNPLLMTAIIIVVALAALAGSFFLAVVLFYMGVLIHDEIKIFMSEPRQTRAQKKMEDLAWQAFLEDLRRRHEEAPINVFRDGVQLV